MYYTVTQVSKMCNVNPETVRRWIRTGILNATLENKKSGFRIDEKSFKDFIIRYPKHRRVVSPTIKRPVIDSSNEIQIRLDKIKDYTKRIDKLVAEIEELM